MRLQLRTTYVIAWLVAGHGAGAWAQNAVSPLLETSAGPPGSAEGRPVAAPAEQAKIHEALQPSGASRELEHSSKAPPSPIAERPGTRCPGPDARWIEGYWEWEARRGEFAWVTGTWLVPSPGEFWVTGYWRRDAKGWYRVPGFWSAGGQIPKDEQAADPPPGWRKVGLPLNRPDERIGIAPGPDFFYVPGEYIPRGDGVVWRQGFWARSQPGWEWIPARWDRRATAWVFREGFWNRVPGPPNPPPASAALVQATTSPFTPAGLEADHAMTLADSTQPGATGHDSGAKKDQTPADASGLKPGGDQTTQNGAPGKPRDPQSGPQPGAPQQPVSAPYGQQPVYPPGRMMMWNARSAFGGFLRRILP